MAIDSLLLLDPVNIFFKVQKLSSSIHYMIKNLFTLSQVTQSNDQSIFSMITNKS